MEINLEKWASVLRTDPGLQERLQRLDPKGYPATQKGDLLCIKLKNDTPIVVRWDGSEIQVTRREAKKPFCLWTMDEETFTKLFLGTCPPLLVAMNNNQDTITMEADHHHGALALSFMVLLQESMEGGEGR